MSNGGFVRLVFLKDVRRYLWPLVLVVAIELTIVLSIRAAGFHAMLAAIIAYLIGLYLTMDIIQLDWPGRDLRLLFTRPVPGEAIFFAKMLFLGLFLILSGWGFQELDYAVLRMPLAPLDHLYLLIETTILSAVAMALVGSLAIFLRKNSHVFFALGLLLIAMLLVSFAESLFPGLAAIPSNLNRAQLCWSALVVLLGLSSFIGLAMIAALVRYRTRRFGPPLMLMVGGMILDLAICMEAAAIGDRRLAHDWPGHMPPHLSDQIRLSKDFSRPENEEKAWNGLVVSHTIVARPTVEGIKAPYYCFVVGSRSTATLRSGKTIRSIAEKTPTTPAQDIGDLMGVPFEAEVIGAGSKKPGIAPWLSVPSFSSWRVPGVSYEKPAITLRAFTYLPSRLPVGEDLTGVTIQGEVLLEIHRAYVAGSIPVKSGAVFSQPLQRYEISEASSLAEMAGFQITCIKLPLMLRGDTGDSAESLSWALVSRPRNEILHDFSYSGSHSTFPVDIAVSTVLYSRTGHYTPDNPPPIDWLKGAEAVFLGNENCGEITVPYEMDNITLTR